MAEFAKTIPRFEGTVYLVQATDHEDGRSETLRFDFLEAHLHYVEKNCERYLICGPQWPPGTEKITGSFFLVHADTGEQARAVVEGDPYVSAGVYANMTVNQISPAAGRLLGGVIWEDAESVKAFASKPRAAVESSE